jgi:hypothetical protein
MFPPATRSYTITRQTTQPYAVAVYGLWTSCEGQQYEALTDADTVAGAAEHTSGHPGGVPACVFGSLALK